MLKENAPAPDFMLAGSDGKLHKLSDYKGRPAVLYFYPKDDTPGCTAEACSFRDHFSLYKEKNIPVLGISPDNEASHQKFSKKHALPFLLLCDPEHRVAEKYGVWGKKKMYGKEYYGILRTTFLIDKNGKVAHIFTKPMVEVHAKEVMGVMKEKGMV